MPIIVFAGLCLIVVDLLVSRAASVRFSIFIRAHFPLCTCIGFLVIFFFWQPSFHSTSLLLCSVTIRFFFLLLRRMPRSMYARGNWSDNIHCILYALLNTRPEFVYGLDCVSYWRGMRPIYANRALVLETMFKWFNILFFPSRKSTTFSIRIPSW